MKRFYAHGRRNTPYSLAASLLLASPAARAWSYNASAHFSAPCPTAATALRVDHESAEIDCSEGSVDELRCAATVRYALRNPSDAVVRATVSASPQGETLSLPGGVPSPSVEIVLEPGASVELTARKQRREEIEHQWEWLRPFGEGALGLMHPLLVERRDRSVRIEIDYQRSTRCGEDRGWSSVGASFVRTHAPRSWSPVAGMEQSGLCREAEGRGLTCAQVEETAQGMVRMAYERPLGGAVRSGGVTVSLGATGASEFRARLGWELGFGRRFVGSASIEGDTGGNVIFTPAFGYAIPLWRVDRWQRTVFPGALVPWVGVPLGVLPDRRVGVRAQASLIWIFAGLDVAVDYWPVDGRADVSVMLRLGI